LRSGEEKSVETDHPQDSDYREDDDFFYLTGIEEPGSWLVLIASDSTPDQAALRLVKDAEELRRMRGTIAATVDAQHDAARAIAPGTWEYQVEAIIEAAFRRNGAERVSFPSIVGSGPNSTTLHYDKSRRQMQSGDLVVID